MKKSVKIAVLILSVMIACLMFASCSKGTKNNNPIIGKWLYVSHGCTNKIEFLENGKFNATFYQAVPSSDNNSSYNLDSPFPYTSSLIAKTYTGNYVINGNKITITTKDSKFKQVSTFTVTSATLTLTTGGTESNGIKTVQETIVFKHA